MLALIEGAAREGAELVGVQVDTAPLEIVKAVNEFMRKQQRSSDRDLDNWTDRALPLGNLWGASSFASSAGNGLV